MIKRITKKLLIIIILVLFIFSNYSFAFDYSKPYESNKNYSFSEEDTNSEVVNNLYFNDDLEIPAKYSLTDTIRIIVSDQGPLGLCNLFANMKSVETNYALKSGILKTKLAENINEYTNAKKIFQDFSDYNTNEDFTGFIGVKLKRNGNNEYFSHLVISVNEQGKSEIPIGNDSNSTKMHIFLNPIDDSFDESKMILLQTIDNEKSGNINKPVILDTPIKIEGEKYAIVIQFEVNPYNELYFGNIDNNSEFQGSIYTSTGFGQEWTPSEYDIPIFIYTVNKAISNLSLKTPPTKTTYIKGEELNLDGCTGTIEYESGEVEEVEFTTRNSEISGFDPNKLGIQTVKIKYKGDSVFFNVAVKNEAVSLTIKTKPTKLVYAKGESLDLTDGQITVTYEDGSTEDIVMAYSEVTITGFDSNIIGEKELTIKYKGFTTKFTVIVTNELKSIQIKKKPTKTTYIKGEQLDLTGGKISVAYEDGETAEVAMTANEIGITGYEASKLGEQELTVTYKGKTAKFKVTVKNDITGISIKTVPTKTTYKKGENLDLTGGEIRVEYEDGETAEIPMTAKKVGITGYDANKVGEQEVTVTYDGKTAKFKVTVKNDIIEIKVKQLPQKTTYTKGENIDLSGGIITVKYEDLTVADIPMTSSKIGISGYDTSTVGNKKIRITYNGKVVEYDITVLEKDGTQSPPKLPYAGKFNIIIIPIVIIIATSFIFYRKNTKYV